MNKKKKMIILLSCVAVVYSVLGVMALIGHSHEDGGSFPMIDSYLHDDSYEFDYLTLSSIATEDITEFILTVDGEPYRFIKDDKQWACDHSGAVTDSVSISYALNTLADIKVYSGNGIQELEATDENLENCGIKNGVSISLSFKDGQTVTYTVGNYLKFGSAYYFTNGDGKIYTVLDRFSNSLISLVD